MRILPVARASRQLRHHRLLPAPCELQHRLAAKPFVRVVEPLQQRLRRRRVHIKRRRTPQRRPLRPHPVDPPVTLAPIIDRPHMAQPRIIPIRHPQRPVGPDLDIHRTKPAVVAHQQRGLVHRLERRGVGHPVAHVDHVLQRVRRDEFSGKLPRHQITVVNHEHLRKPLPVSRRRHVLKIAIRVGIPRKAVFPEILHPTHALIEMHAAVATVSPTKKTPLRINLATEGIAAALGENLEHRGLWMIPPEVLPFEAHLLGHRAAHVARRRTPRCSVEPAIRSKLQRARHRVRVFESESAQAHLGIAVRHVVVVRIGIKQQIRRIHHPNTARALEGRGRHIEPGDHIFAGLVNPVAIAVLKHRDLIRPFDPTRRRLGDLVELRAEMVIVTCNFQPCRKRILDILRDPQPTA